MKKNYKIGTGGPLIDAMYRPIGVIFPSHIRHDKAG